MADKTFVPTTGASDWATSGNWTPAGVPATGDRVFITTGDGALVITTASTQAAVLLAELNIYDTFKGSLVIDVHATMVRHGFPSGSTSGNGGSGKTTLNNGAALTTIIVYKTGSSTDSNLGLGAFRWTGTNTGNKITVLSGSVDIGTDLSAAVVTELDILGGTVAVGQNATTNAVTLTSGTLTHNGLATATTGSINNTGGTVTTNGTTKFTTITCSGGNTYINHRAASGDDVATLTILNGGTVDLTNNPKTLALTNAVVPYRGASIRVFSSTQLSAGIAVASPCIITFS